MPSPGDPIMPHFPVEDSFLELLADTLETLDSPARGQFLQRYFRAITQLELNEAQCLQYWEQALDRRRELSVTAGRPVSLKTALVDVLSSANQLRVPVVMEYGELKKLQLDAATDPLTGLYNRRLFNEYFEKELNRARRHLQQLALMIMDLHRFKEVNDKFGHPQGDEVLRLAAQVLKKGMRTSDYAFRIGGDEFALLLPQSDADQATALARRLHIAFEEAMRPLKLGVPVGLDHGVSVYPQDGEQGEVLIRVADERLYRLKHMNHRQEPPPPPPETSSARPILVKPSGAPAPPQFASVQQKPVERKTEPPTLAAGPAVPPEPRVPAETFVLPPPPAKPSSDHRRAERVSLAGTRAYAVVGDTTRKTARVLDLGFGGVGLQLDSPEELGETFSAVLHVPILPPVRVTLRRVYVQRNTTGLARVGCAFVA
jgi:diguanylate cyclase (GGDEF)-like protein